MRDYSFGNFLHELRLSRGLTQYQLGALVGVSDKAVSKWENGTSKPQSNILYKLSKLLGVSVDELLACKYNSSEKEESKGVFAMKKQLWDKAFNAMFERFGNPAPIEITNRLLTEQAEMQNSDIIIFFDLLSLLVSEAKKQGEYIRVSDYTGAFLVAYLLGATEINPLKPHYFCSECRSLVFDDNAKNGWDLPKRKCTCGKEMLSDGHNISFEPYRYDVHKNLFFHISVSPKYLPSAKAIVQNYFKDCKLTIKKEEETEVVLYTELSEKSKFSITLLICNEYVQYKKLMDTTAIPFEEVQFDSKEVLEEIRKCNTEGVIGLRAEFITDMLKKFHPESFYELIHLSGLSHIDSEKLIRDSTSLSNIFAYRDDVFNYVQEKMNAKGLTDTGFAYKVMKDTYRGIYSQNGVPYDIQFNLKAIGMDDSFIKSISSVRYLFCKTYGITSIKLGATLMWYKMYYPKEFNEIIMQTHEIV